MTLTASGPRAGAVQGGWPLSGLAFRVPGRQHLSFAFGGNAGVHLRLAIGRLLLEPIQSRLRRIGQRTKCQTLRESFLYADRCKATTILSARWNPHRHIAPRTNLLFGEKLCV